MYIKLLVTPKNIFGPINWNLILYWTIIALGGDVTRTTKAGDTALYLATFGVLSSVQPDLQVLEDIIKSGQNF